MFRILQDSIFNPKGLVKQVNRSGWFVFLFLIIMAIFMSFGSFVAFTTYVDPTIDESTTGCAVVENQIKCDGDNYDINDLFYLYGIRVYFLDSDMTIEDIPTMEADSIVFQGNSISLYINRTSLGSVDFFTEDITLTEGFNQIKGLILISSIITTVIMNFFLILSIVLISTLMFARYKKYIKYKKLFKLVVFAVTPVALLITFYNLLDFGMVFFFILSIGAYRSLFVINRELYTQMMRRKYQEENNVVDMESDDEEED